MYSVLSIMLLYRVGQKSDTSRTYITLYERYHFFGPPGITCNFSSCRFIRRSINSWFVVLKCVYILVGLLFAVNRTFDGMRPTTEILFYLLSNFCKFRPRYVSNVLSSGIIRLINVVYNSTHLIFRPSTTRLDRSQGQKLRPGSLSALDYIFCHLIMYDWHKTVCGSSWRRLAVEVCMGMEINGFTWEWE